MSPYFRTLLLPLLLSLPLTAAAAPPAEPAPTPPGHAIDALVADILKNVDWALLVRIQENLSRNFDVLVPYTEEYLACLEAEGSLAPDAPLDLRTLVDSARHTSGRCRVILQALAGQLQFDITPEELERGLSPEYRELLKKSL